MDMDHRISRENGYGSAEEIEHKSAGETNTDQPGKLNANQPVE